MIAVVKVGGAAPGAAAQVAALAASGRQVVVVHGAGPQITAGCVAAGLEPRFVDGQRRGPVPGGDRGERGSRQEDGQQRGEHDGFGSVEATAQRVPVR